MRLYMVRHGQTQANAEQRYLGSLDPELNASGREQAAALSLELPDSIDLIAVSPLRRARQTAEILNYRAHLPLQVVDAFRERNVGVFEGLTQAEAQQLYPELWRQNITRQWDASPPDGESISQVVARVHQGLVTLAEEGATQNVLLVGHGFVAKTVRALVRQDFSDLFDWQLGNGHWLVLEHVERIVDFDLPVQSPLP
ncbi:MAG: histidine phosphatase family protein [Pseudomonas sp.]|jgi:probable phosphoglycerate mutase|uniref:histidine phosphatase family protein n=1 Tax=Pseudomonas sp. TaxID=306 RepID=UPI0023A38CA4|nr:histidine phosphatase family protein [Pseudomonas sp.]MDE1194204.1 histidine phosphatase family protein [Pseudomonas sp.]